MQFIQENWVAIVAVLGSISEGLSLIPGIKSNGIFQLFYGLILEVIVQVECHGRFERLDSLAQE